MIDRRAQPFGFRRRFGLDLGQFGLWLHYIGHRRRGRDRHPGCIYNTQRRPATIGGIAATVGFAGWVSGSVAGLYQINVQVPVRTSSFIDASGTTAPATTTALHLPVVVTANTISSQPIGVNVWVVGSLLLTQTGPTTSGHSGAASTWGTSAGNTNSSVVATDGVGSETYTYSVSGADATALAAIGLTMGSNGQVTGTATAGTATVTVTATGGTSGITGTLVVTYTIS